MLTEKELEFYHYLLSQADPSGSNQVGGMKSVEFFKKSGLSKDALKDIWLLSAKTSP